MEATTTNPIAELNDQFRKAAPNQDWRFTRGAIDLKAELERAIAAFNDFNEGNDPYKEHDFGAVAIADDKYFWKIDYYDLDLKWGSEDPSDPKVTRRFMTVMHCSEY
jgi:hypothetical protein